MFSFLFENFLLFLVEPVGKNGARRVTRNNSKNKPHELDQQGLVPLPAKNCFSCRRSCKKAPLVACDYCPLFFHQDCLNPPLTALPAGMWMCPNHPEQFIDWKLVTSISATERVKLWNRYTGPVDQETVKADFIRKVHFKNPPFRTKLKSKPRNKIEIPSMIEYHYKNPPKLLPSLRDVLRCDSKTNKIADTIETDLVQIQNDVKTNLICNETLEEQLPPPNKKSKLTNVDVELENFDLSLIKLLAFQRLQEILMENPNLLNKKSNDLKSINEICKSSPIMNMPLPSQLLSKEDIEKIAREFGSSQSDCEDDNQFNLIKKEIYYPETVQEKAQHFATNIQLKMKDSKIRARAVIVPVDGILNDETKWLTKYSLDGSTFMRYRKLTIGTGPGNDLQLINNSHCTHISNKHAVIFFDDATNNFELLNYSEYGTEVNGQLYSCDFTEHEPTPSRIVNDPKCFYENVRNILDKRRGVVREEQYEVDVNAR